MTEFIDELERLARLHESGALTESQFEAAKEKLLGAARSATWEIAEMSTEAGKHFGFVGSGREYRLKLTRTGPSGTALMAQWPWYKIHDDCRHKDWEDQARNWYDSLIASMLRDGWEITGYGQDYGPHGPNYGMQETWYLVRLRRALPT